MVLDSLLIGNTGGVEENIWSNEEFIQPPAGVEIIYQTYPGRNRGYWTLKPPVLLVAPARKRVRQVTDELTEGSLC